MRTLAEIDQMIDQHELEHELDPEACAKCDALFTARADAHDTEGA